jgi:hypothetical protein
MSPKLAMVRPESKFRQLCFDFAEKKNFEIIILIAICTNTFSMCIKWPNMDENLVSILGYSNAGFSLFFGVEAIIKLAAYGRRYFIDKWNVFDFIVVLCSIILNVLNLGWGIGNANISSVMRSLRIGRTFKLFRKLK